MHLLDSITRSRAPATGISYNSASSVSSGTQQSPEHATAIMASPTNNKVKTHVMNSLSKAGKLLFFARRNDGTQTVLVTPDVYPGMLKSEVDSGYHTANGNDRVDEGVFTRQNTAQSQSTPVAGFIRTVDFANLDEKLKGLQDDTAPTKDADTPTIKVSEKASNESDEVFTVNDKATKKASGKPDETPKAANEKITIRPYTGTTSSTTQCIDYASPPSSSSNSSLTLLSANSIDLRLLFKKLAYSASVHGCPTAATTISHIDAHRILLSRNAGPANDPVYTYLGYQFHYSSIGPIERTWMSRHLMLEHITSLVDQRALYIEDAEIIQEHLLPTSEKDILPIECFALVISNLVNDGTISNQTSKQLIKLAHTRTEYLAGPTTTCAKKTFPADLPFTTFTHLPRLTSPDRKRYLRHLLEAAAYTQTFWKGVFYASAAGQLDDYHNAHVLATTGLVDTPPHLTAFKRAWTPTETRMLARGSKIAELQRAWASGGLVEYRVLKAVRGTFVNVPGQPWLDVEQLASLLYSAASGGGIVVGEIPGILALHPDLDGEAEKMPGVFGGRVRGFVVEAGEFRRGEEERWKEIERAVGEMERVRRAEMTRCQRWADKVKKLFRRKAPAAAPFDPFGGM